MSDKWEEKERAEEAVEALAAVEKEREALAQRLEATADVTVNKDAAEAYRRAARMIRNRSKEES